MLTRKASFLVSLSLLLAGLALGGEAIPNWSAPATWSSAKSRGGLTTMGDVTSPLPFIGLAPCRIVDTRGNGAPITGGIFTGGSDVRNYTIPPICGVPFGVRAVSLNFTVTGPGQTTAGFLLAWPTGGAVPPVSMLNWDRPQQQIANAAVVPTNGSGSITVNVSAPTHVIIDINGYYASTPGTSANYFSIVGSGLYAIYGQTSNPSGNAAAVYGLETAGATSGVWGDNTSTANQAAGVFGRIFASSGNGSGVWGRTHSTSTGATGTFGEAVVTSGVTYGVVGTTNSSLLLAPAGVLGFTPPRIAANGFDRAGVRGECSDRTGVLGLSSSSDFGIAVAGILIDSTGSVRSFGRLGDGTVSLGVSYFGGLGGSGTKTFYEPHPTDPEKVIRYVSLEGPEAGTYFRGRGQLVHGRAVIDVPESFRIVTDEEGLTAQVTPIGRPTLVSVSQLDLDLIVVEGSRDVEFSYLVQGVRRNYKDFEVVAKSRFFQPRSAEDRMIGSLSEGEKVRLVANGTYNADGTVNIATAERLGWVKMWKEREEQARAAAANAISQRAAILDENK